MVEFELPLPPRRPVDADFTSPPIPEEGVLTADERQHRELLAALEDLTALVAESAAEGGAAASLPAQPGSTLDPYLLAEAIRSALGPMLESQGGLTTEALSQVVEQLKTLRKMVVALSSSGSGGGHTGNVIVDSGNIALSQPVALDAVALGAVREALTDAELRATPVPVSGTVTVTDNRTLTERMLAKAPQANHSLYLDTADTTYIYLAEGPTADTAASTTAQGIRVVKDASGNPLGRVQIATGFAWNSRSGATWT